MSNIFNKPFFIHSNYSANNTYWSFFTSLLFIIPCYLLKEKKLKYLTLLLTIISTIHHTRSYNDKFDDIFQVIDQTIAIIFGLVVCYYFFSFRVFVLLLLLLIFQIKIDNSNIEKSKSMYHACFHLVMIIFLIVEMKLLKKV